MFIKHLGFYILLNVCLNFYGLTDTALLTSAAGQKLLESVIKLTDSLLEVTPYINSTLNAAASYNCIQMLCKFVCFNGKSMEIENDIFSISKKNKYFCSDIEELRLYNYEFPDKKLSQGFLGVYSDKVHLIYLASSNLIEIEAAAFAKGKFQAIYLENLQINELKGDLFKGVTYELNTFSLIQKTRPLLTIHANFLDYIKSQIKYLTIQAGIKSVRNLTAAAAAAGGGGGGAGGSDFLLQNLVYTDFSHNDFGTAMQYNDFAKVTYMEHLDLSHCNLEYLPAYLFADFIATLDYLNLSYNKLKTISQNIFGWRKLPRDLKIYVSGNEWLCSCERQREMKNIFVFYQKNLFCSQPDSYAELSVFDEKICDGNFSPEEDTNALTTIAGMDNTTVSIASTTAAANNDKETTAILNAKTLMKLNCLANPISMNDEPISHLMQAPLIDFTLRVKEKSTIEITIDPQAKAFGLIWFNKVTTKYFQMEINYKEYGLGCQQIMSAITALKHLIPNTSYTFCLVFLTESKVSPFNCKSIYLQDNVAIKQTVWLTCDMKMTGWSLVALGIFLFLCTGILMIYLLLKRMPVLLKNSKRVTRRMYLNNHGIVVMPKKSSIDSLKEKEEKLSGQFNYSEKHRRKSTGSEVSYESYMTNNLYEVIPPLENLKTSSSISLPPPYGREKHRTDVDNQDIDDSYLTPLQPITYTADVVPYAEIPCRANRNLSDDLPQLPTGQLPFSNKMHSRREYARMGNIYYLDSEV